MFVFVGISEYFTHSAIGEGVVGHAQNLRHPHPYGFYMHAVLCGVPLIIVALQH